MRKTGEREWPLGFDAETFRSLLHMLAHHNRAVEMTMLLQSIEDTGVRLPPGFFDPAAAPVADGAGGAREMFGAPDGRTPLTSWMATDPEAVRTLAVAQAQHQGTRAPCCTRTKGLAAPRRACRVRQGGGGARQGPTSSARAAG